MESEGPPIGFCARVTDYPLLPLSEPGEPPRSTRFWRDRPTAVSPTSKATLRSPIQPSSNGPGFRRERVIASRRSIAPERALVFGVMGSISDFYQLVASIRGLEFLADEETLFDPDDDFVEARQGKHGQPGQAGGRQAVPCPILGLYGNCSGCGTSGVSVRSWGGDVEALPPGRGFNQTSFLTGRARSFRVLPQPASPLVGGPVAGSSRSPGE